MKTKELKEEIKNCKECCYVRDMTNIKPALCNFHQGVTKGRQEAIKEEIKFLKKNVLLPLKLRGGNKYNEFKDDYEGWAKEIKQRIKELKSSIIGSEKKK